MNYKLLLLSGHHSSGDIFCCLDTHLQFSARLKTELFIRSYYASAQPS